MKKVVAKENERGFALVLALVFMLAMTIIGVSLITNMSTEMHLASNEKDAKLAFQVSEAGFQDALARIHLASSSALYAGEPAGLNFATRDSNWSSTFTSAEGDLDYTVTIKYLLESSDHNLCDSNTTGPNSSDDADPDYANIPPNDDSDPDNIYECTRNGEIVYFGQDFNVSSETTTLTYGQFPVYEITSTGTAGGSNSTRTVTGYIGSTNLDLDTGFAVDTNACVSVGGVAFEIDGVVNQDAGCTDCDTLLDSTPGEGCTARASPAIIDDYLGLPMADVKAMSDEIHYCIGFPNCSDDNDDIPNSGQIDGVVQDWGDFAGDTYGSYIYIDNPGNKVVLTGDFQGRGLLMINGDLQINGGFNYEGFVFVNGELTLGGGANEVTITGGLFSTELSTFNGNITVDYDQATLEDVSRQNKSQALLLWKRE